MKKFTNQIKKIIVSTLLLCVYSLNMSTPSSASVHAPQTLVLTSYCLKSSSIITTDIKFEYSYSSRGITNGSNSIRVMSLQDWGALNPISKKFSGKVAVPMPGTAFSSCSLLNEVLIIPPTPEFCIKPGGAGVVWKHSSESGVYAENVFINSTSITVQEWAAKSQHEKVNSPQIAITPVPLGGCSSLNESIPIMWDSVCRCFVVTTVAPTTTPAPTTTVAPTTTPAPTTTVAPTTTLAPTTTTTTGPTCPPTKDFLYSHSYSYGLSTGGGYLNVTNYGGNYDTGSYGYTYDYGRRCDVAPITSVLIRTNDGVTSQVSRFVSFQPSYNTSNCWEVARVSIYGQSPWSNKVCHVAPAPTTTTTTTTTTTLPPVTYPTPTLPSWTPATPQPATQYTNKKVSTTKSIRYGAICKDGTRSSATGSGACSWHGGVRSWLTKNVVTTKTVRVPVTGSSYSSSSTGNCYGCISSSTGKLKTNWVNGYFKSNGTYVQGYWRS